MNEAGLFSGDRIRQLIGEVADQLDSRMPQATVLIDHPRLKVLGAPLWSIFLMN